jgi:hypothetical protein
MRRREFIAGLAWPLAARAAGERVRRIGVLMASDKNDPVWKPALFSFARALAELGWTGSPPAAKGDRYSRGRCQRCVDAEGYDHRDAAADEIGRKHGQPIILILCITIYNRHVWPGL